MNLVLKSFILILIVSCEISSTGSNQTYEPEPTLYEEKQYANSIKYISTGISDPRSEATFAQEEYLLNDNNRLLVRLSKMGNRTARAVVNDENKMFFAISSEAFVTDKASYADTIEVCPITKNWMMLATWSQAHSLPGASARWRSKGGDYSQRDCVKADISYVGGEVDALYFDMTNWFLYYVQSRSKNFGLIIKSSTDVVIYGDDDSIRNPRFIWQTL